MSQFRSIIVAPQHGGQECPSLVKQITCHAAPCPVDCVVSEWSTYNANGIQHSYTNTSANSVCSVSCGSGITTIYRSIVTQASYGGKACPALSMEIICNAFPCPIDCVLSNWAYYNIYDPLYYSVGQCTASCNGGTQGQYRTILVRPSFGGAACGPLSQAVTCNTQACPQDCIVSSWSDYVADNANGAATSCSATCGGGVKSQYRTVIAYPQYGGAACPDLNRQITCNTQSCPGDCIVSQWSTDYSTCSVSCGGGVVTSYRSVIAPSKYSGHACPALTKTTVCNVQACPVDCVV